MHRTYNKKIKTLGEELKKCIEIINELKYTLDLKTQDKILVSYRRYFRIKECIILLNA